MLPITPNDSCRKRATSPKKAYRYSISNGRLQTELIHHKGSNGSVGETSLIDWTECISIITCSLLLFLGFRRPLFPCNHQLTHLLNRFPNSSEGCPLIQAQPNSPTWRRSPCSACVLPSEIRATYPSSPQCERTRQDPIQSQELCRFRRATIQRKPAWKVRRIEKKGLSIFRCPADSVSCLRMMAILREDVFFFPGKTPSLLSRRSYVPAMLETNYSQHSCTIRVVGYLQ